MVLPLLIPIIAAGLGAVGKIIGGIGANNAAKARAQSLEMGAQQALNESGIAAQMGLEDDERVAGRLATMAGAGIGGGLGGSSMAVLGDLGRQSLMKARNVVYRGQTEAWAKRNDATVTRMQGQVDLTTSILSAGSSMLGAFASGAEAKRG